MTWRSGIHSSELSATAPQVQVLLRGRGGNTLQANCRNHKKFTFCFGMLPILFLVLQAAGTAASWTKVTGLALSGAGVMLQLPDGTIMIQRSSNVSWMRLTPDAQGSYINGTWSALT